MNADQMIAVSVIIPCRNEVTFIDRCLDSIITQDYPKDKIEVFVVDGMSNDGTRDIVGDYADRFSFVKLIDNLRKVTPVALNIGIRSAQGEVIVIMSAHASYPHTYISTCIEYLEKTGADGIGGPVVTMPGADSLIGRSIALATSHPFGVGNSRFRTSSKAGYVDTVPFGAYPHHIFNKVGFFNESLVRNQDNEFSSRIIDGGGKIYFTPELTAYYYNQPTISGLLKQAFRTGMWNIATIRINRSAFRWRHFIPFIFVTALMTLGVLTPLFPRMLPACISLIGVYAGAAAISSFQIGMRSGLRYIPILPAVFFLYHVCYGLGTWTAVLKLVFTGWQNGSEHGHEVGENSIEKEANSRFFHTKQGGE